MWSSRSIVVLYSAVRKILTKARQLVDVKKDDGFAALHLAALNGHLKTAEALIDVVSFMSLAVFNPLTPTVVIRVQLAIKHLMPDRVKPSFVIFDIRVL